jgi:hypothetical protein
MHIFTATLDMWDRFPQSDPRNKKTKKSRDVCKNVIIKERRGKMKKGIAELGVLVVQALVIAAMAVGNAGVFSSDPTSLGFNCAVQGLTAYSQMPHVKRDFRERKAVNEFGVTEAEAQAMSDSELLDAIRDNAPGQETHVDKWTVANSGMRPRLGG